MESDKDRSKPWHAGHITSVPFVLTVPSRRGLSRYACDRSAEPPFGLRRDWCEEREATVNISFIPEIKRNTNKDK